MTTTIAAKDVAELRARTGAGMMDCKRALEEANGDMSRAAELLRAKGIAKAEKRAGRTTAQGLVAGMVSEDGTSGAMLELTCETDFVARTEDFGNAAEKLLGLLAASPPMTTEQFLASPTDGQTVADLVKGVSGKTGEGVALRNAVRFAPGSGGTVGLYLHHNKLVGVLAEVSGDAKAVRTEAAAELAREVALHVASANPIAVQGSDLPADVLDRERRIAEEQAAEEGKPEAIRGKIVEGKVKKFIAENALVDQPWVKDDKKTVGQLVAEMSKAAGGELKVARFLRIKVGEA